MDAPDGFGLLTVAEVADRMRVSKMTVYRLVHRGELPAVRFGRTFRVQRGSVEELIRKAHYGGVDVPDQRSGSPTGRDRTVSEPPVVTRAAAARSTPSAGNPAER